MTQGGDRLELVSDISIAKADNEVLRTELGVKRASSKAYQAELTANGLISFVGEPG